MNNPLDVVKPIWLFSHFCIGVRAFELVKRSTLLGFWRRVIYRKSDGTWRITGMLKHEISRHNRPLNFINTNSIKTTVAYEMWFEHTDDRVKAKNIIKWMSIWQKKNLISLAGA